MTNRKVFHIAAVSLIEIMMIFSIIGIVTGACMSLNKPKNEYMTKIKLYSAFMALDAAAKQIAQETHIDLTTDANTCYSGRTSTNICKDYKLNESYPGISASLPKVVQRRTESSETTPEVDAGLLTHTIYSSLSPSKKEQFKYLQSGLCQRMAKTMNIPASGINCNSTLIDTKHPASIAINKAPQLYLPNGQVIYFYQNLLSDIRTSNGIVTSSIISVASSIALSNEAQLLSSSAKCTNLNSQVPSLLNGSSASSILLFLPNETKLAALKEYKTCYPANAGTTNVKYWQKMWEKNKDYFIVYVDINGKMMSATDKQYGPDRLNVDIFAFRIYRDGTVLPDYLSGFPLTYLTAKLLVKDKTDPSGKYMYQSDAYSIQPLGFSRCYANLAGSYSSDHPYDNVGICTRLGTTRAPLNDCITSLGDSICKSIINKPSFLIR